MIRTLLTTALLLSAAPALAQAPSAGMPRAKLQADAEAEFKRVDTNGDGQMSVAEIEKFQTARYAEQIAARAKQVFGQLDSDKNGQLSLAEFAKLNPPRKIDASSVLRIDANKDNKISLDEHRGAALKTFDQFDSDKNGILTQAEVERQRTQSR